MTGLICTPLAVERRAIRPVLREVPVLRVGMGRRAAPPETTGPVVVAGVAGGLAPQVRPGDIVVADEVRWSGDSVPIPSAPLLVGALRRLGLNVHCGPIVSSDRIVDGKARLSLAASGALAVDLESAALAARATGPVAVIRSIVDTAQARLWAPGTMWRGIRALRALRAAAPALRWWLAAIGPREITPDADLILKINKVEDIDLRRLAGVRRIGIAAPSGLTDAVVHALSGLGPVTVREEGS
jgi:4-hydroxy-3-methylbut-2-enyl diphosphate reductase